MEIEGNKMNKFKSFLSDISNMENSVGRSTIEKRQLYENLMKQISKLSKETEEEQHANVKLQLQIQNKLEAFIKNNDRSFEKLKAERLSTQERLNSFLESKIEGLIKKCTNMLIQVKVTKLHQSHYNNTKKNLYK